MAGLEGEVLSPDAVFGAESPTHNSKPSPLCPHCHGSKLWRDGVRYSIFGESIQRWLCRDCGLRFSDPEDVKNSWSSVEKITRNREESLKTEGCIVASRQICVEETKNLEQEQAVTSVPGMNRDAKGMLVQYQAKMDLEGYTPETIRGAASCLRALIARNADLNDPESVKLALAKEEKKEKHWSQNRRRNVINAYTLFLQFQNRSWIKPKCKVDEKFPFIPHEAEIDALIAGSFKKLAAYLQILKETAMRSGEAHSLEWINIDTAQRIITLNKPEKHSKARMFKVSQQLIDMLNNLPKRSEKVFPCSKKGMKTTFQRNRKKLAVNLVNPRLLQIHFHTFRHWKATMLYHETKDAHYVQHFLGHKSIKSTETYINIENDLFQSGPNDKFTVRVSDNPKEIAELIADGFEAHCNQGNLIFLRKRK